MKNIIVYTSQTGFTEKYANLLGEKINGEVLTLKDAKKKPDSFFADADSIVYAGWLMAGKVTGSDWMVKRLSAFSGKKLAFICVGASPVDAPDVKTAMERLLNHEQRKAASIFYMPGGISYEKMKGPSRFAMKAFASMLKKKKDQTEAERQMAELISHDYDHSDPKYLDPVIAYINA